MSFLVNGLGLENHRFVSVLNNRLYTFYASALNVLTSKKAGSKKISVYFQIANTFDLFYISLCAKMKQCILSLA